MQYSSVSIIIPTCDSARPLEHLLSSLLEAGPALSTDLIIIDHGSRDDISQVVSRFATKAFIRLISRNVDTAMGSFLQLGAAKAEDPYVFIIPPVAADFHILLPTALKEMDGQVHKALTCTLDSSTKSGKGFFRIQSLASLVSQKAILDPCASVSSFVTAATGLSVLCRRIELKAMTGKNSLKKELPYKPQVFISQGTASEKQKPKSKAKSQAESTIQKLRFKLFNLGFTERAYVELKELAADKNNPDLRGLAARELAVWEANKRSVQGAENCLKWLRVVKKDEQGLDYLRQAAILEAECLHLLGHHQEAKAVVWQALKKQKHPDLYFSAVNLEPDLPGRLEWINKALELYGLSAINCETADCSSSYAGLYALPKPAKGMHQNFSEPKVTVIVPAYNAQETIHIALNSLLAQTWTNLEILVVDDCSQDNTLGIVREYELKDTRVQHFQTERNSGPYIARNIGLVHASGEFVTVNDADDWSHPEKIAVQALHLMHNPSCMANTSQYCRIFPDLSIYRRGNHGKYIIKNFSSLMFRRQPVLERIGYWDCVRFEADADFLERLDRVFGVVNLETGPLLFAGQSPDTLSGDQVFGVPGYIMGCRLEYQECRRSFFEAPSSLYYEFPQRIRPFPVPEPMWPQRAAKPNGRRHFEVIIVADFRKTGQTTGNILQEIKLLKYMGVRTGLLHIPSYDLPVEAKIEPGIRKITDHDLAQMVVYGEKLVCDTLIVRDPEVLQEWSRFVPDVEADQIRVVVFQEPAACSKSSNRRFYSIRRWKKNLQKYFGSTGLWHPIDSETRKFLLRRHSEELGADELAETDWPDIQDAISWKSLLFRQSHNLGPDHGSNRSSEPGPEVQATALLQVLWPKAKFQIKNAGLHCQDGKARPEIETQHAELQTARQRCWTNYLQGVGEKQARALFNTVLRNGSYDGRDLLAWHCSGGRMGFEGIIHLLQGQKSQLLETISSFNARSTISLARAMAAQSLKESDLQNALQLFLAVLKAQGSGAVSQLEARFFSELSISLGQFTIAWQLLNCLPLKPFDRKFIECDLVNPVHGGEDLTLWLNLFNGPFADIGLEAVQIKEGKACTDPKPLMDSVYAEPKEYVTQGPLVSVIMPVWCPDQALLNSVRSLLWQSWANLEILIVDDCSPVGYEDIFQQCREMDARITILRQPRNLGAYAARNMALQRAKGEFVTFQDADDWSHPRRIEKQVRTMQKEDGLPACRCSVLRTDENLCFALPGRPYVQYVAWSLFFRREPVLERIGFMDPVRKAADTEYAMRISQVFDHPILDMKPGPLGIYRTTRDSLSGLDFKPGWRHPARSSYREAFEYWHKLIARGHSSANINSGQEQRKFPAPWKYLCKVPEKPCFIYDAVIIADWRNTPGLSQKMYEELKRLTEMNKKVAICQVESFQYISEDFESKSETIRYLLHSKQIDEILFDDLILAKHVIFRNPEVLQFPPYIQCRWKVERASILVDKNLENKNNYVIIDLINCIKEKFNVEPELIISDDYEKYCFLINYKNAEINKEMSNSLYKNIDSYKKNILIHIGLPKTASTFLQYRIFKKFPYADCILESSHTEYIKKLRALLHARSQRESIKHLKYDFMQLILSNHHNLQIISNENLSIAPNMMWQKDAPINPTLFAYNLAYFRDTCLDDGCNVQILLTLRRQDTWLAARYAQSGFYTQNAGQNDFESQVQRILDDKYETHGIWLDYNRLYSEITAYFPENSVHLLLQEDLEHDYQIWLKKLKEITNASGLEQLFQRADLSKKANSRQSEPFMWRLRCEDSRDVCIELTKPLSEWILSTYRSSNALLCQKCSLQGHKYNYY